MTANGSARLSVVAPPEVPRDVPEDILRYAGLDPDRRALLLHVQGLLEEIAYGSVVIVLQDGAVMQIETSEKIRLR